MVRGFKVGVTTEARRRGIPFDWQTRFHDHIIRNQREYDTITDYVVNNPALWHQDRFRLPEP